MGDRSEPGSRNGVDVRDGVRRSEALSTEVGEHSVDAVPRCEPFKLRRIQHAFLPRSNVRSMTVKDGSDDEQAEKTRLPDIRGRWEDRRLRR